MSVRVGTGNPVTFDCSPKRFEINVPLEADRITRVVFDLPTEVDISGEGNRLVAMRFLGWRVESGSMKNVTFTQIRKPADLPPFLATDGRW